MTVEPSLEELFALLVRAFPGGPHLDRRLGRAFAFQALYEMDLAHHQPARVIERLDTAARTSGETRPWSAHTLAEARDYAEHLVQGVLQQHEAIDARIQERAPQRPLAQLSAVDRNVLRIGLYESLYGDATVPVRAAINEAVELAKLFGSETSSKFVNGVMGRAVGASGSPNPAAAEPVEDADPDLDPPVTLADAADSSPDDAARGTSRTHAD